MTTKKENTKEIEIKIITKLDDLEKTLNSGKRVLNVCVKDGKFIVAKAKHINYDRKTEFKVFEVKVEQEAVEKLINGNIADEWQIYQAITTWNGNLQFIFSKVDSTETENDKQRQEMLRAIVEASNRAEAEKAKAREEAEAKGLEFDEEAYDAERAEERKETFKKFAKEQLEEK